MPTLLAYPRGRLIVSCVLRRVTTYLEIRGSRGVVGRAKSRNVSVESLTETNYPRHLLRMRLLLGLLAVVALACAIGACAAIAGLGPYTVSDCQQDDTCDGGVNPGHPDSTTPGTDGRAGNDDTGPGPGDDGGVEAGCAADLLSCAGGCMDPSATTSCGACENVCEGDAALCATGDAGTYGCVGSCPANAPTDCNGTCTDTTSDPKNCSGCGVSFACEPGQTCVNSVCTSPGGPVDARRLGRSRVPTAAARLSTPTRLLLPVRAPATARRASARRRAAASAPTTTSARAASASRSPARMTSRAGAALHRVGRPRRLQLRAREPGHPLARRRGHLLVPDQQRLQEHDALLRSDAHELLLHGGQPVPERQVRSELEQRQLLGVHRDGDPGLSRVSRRRPSSASAPSTSGARSTRIASTRPATATTTSRARAAIASRAPTTVTAQNCTGTGADDGHGCMPAPSSVACVGTGGTTCTTTLDAAARPQRRQDRVPLRRRLELLERQVRQQGQPVHGHVHGHGLGRQRGLPDRDLGRRTRGPARLGNCNNVSSPTGTCTAAGVPCWCTSDSQCPSGTQCATWSGCASSACTGSGSGNAFNCVP